jgi:hypothetical protein
VRAVSVYCETFPDGEFAAVLAELLRQTGIAGHAWTSLDDALSHMPSSSVDTVARNVALRELYLARALWRCGDRQELAAGILERYAKDIRGHFARHARLLLKSRGTTRHAPG